MGAGKDGKGRRELVQAPRRPGYGPEAINKPIPARHSRVSASSAAPRADGGGNSRASTDCIYKSVLEQTQAGCEKHFRSIKFLPLTRCQNIPRRRAHPGWGHPEPAGRATPPPRRPDDRQLPESASSFLPTAICLGGGEPRRDKGAARQTGGSGEALPRGSRAPAEAGKLARPTAFPFQRKQRPASYPWTHFLGRMGTAPEACGQLVNPNLPGSCGAVSLAEPGGVVRARPLLAVPLAARPHHRIALDRAHCWNPGRPGAQSLEITLGRQAELLSSHLRPVLLLRRAS